MTVLSLRHFFKADKFPPYLAIRGEFEPKDERVFLIGTKVMRWDETTYLINIENVINYWKWIASHRNQELTPFFESYLAKTFRGDYSFSLGFNPWQSLILLELQLLMEDLSFSCLGTSSANQFYQQQTWVPWKKCYDRLKVFLPKKEQSDFNLMSSRWERFVERMQVERPFEIQNLSFESIERRFGKWWGRIWKWHFVEFLEDDGPVQGDLFKGHVNHYDESFPWKHEKMHEPPFVERFLDVPLLEWDHMSGLIVEDLEKLLRNSPWLEHQKITLMTWSLSFENLKVESCNVGFRNPHSLTDDAPEFKTFLCQAYYSYLNLMQKLEQREDDLDYPIKMATIGWKLEVTESLYLSPQERNILTHEVSNKGLLERLKIENKLPYDLETYSPTQSFLPEYSFKKGDACIIDDKEFWLSASQKRPLFVLQKIEPFDLKKDCRRKIFLERVSCPWWKGLSPKVGDRDYFMIEDHKHTLWWVFQAPSGKWYKHGIFS